MVKPLIQLHIFGFLPLPDGPPEKALPDRRIDHPPSHIDLMYSRNPYTSRGGNLT